MSSSDAARRIRGGRVIMGLRTRDLDEVNAQARSSIRIDTPETEARFLERVRERAREKASTLISEAMTEARTIRQKAMDEGHREGLARADEELQTMKDELSSDVATIFSNLKQEKKKIWEEYRQDMIFVLKASIDRILGMEISENRARIMESLLDQSLELAESNKELSISVSSDDEQTVRELLEMAREKHPEIGSCRIKSSEKIKKGGLILENGNGVVDNTLDSRYEQIKQIVDQLSLSEED